MASRFLFWVFRWWPMVVRVSPSVWLLVSASPRIHNPWVARSLSFSRGITIHENNRGDNLRQDPEYPTIESNDLGPSGGQRGPSGGRFLLFVDGFSGVLRGVRGGPKRCLISSLSRKTFPPARYQTRRSPRGTGSQFGGSQIRVNTAETMIQLWIQNM